MVNQDGIRRIIDECLREYPCELELIYNEPMAFHTTFRVGGPADCYAKPQGEGFPAFAACLLRAARADGTPVFILGGGANIVVADRGIRGIVLDTSGWTGKTEEGDAGPGDGPAMRFRSGTGADAAAELAAGAALSGLEFLAGMPGSIGGAVWMNARCYEREIADALIETEIIDFSEAEESSKGSVSRFLRIPADRAAFGYKRSPFQSRPCLILSAGFALKSGREREIRGEMEAHRRNREAKGHYRYPSAGSAFRNNRAFGKPTGKIIDELGLRGLRIGGAQVAPFHGNIIINAGGAAAGDIRALTGEVAARVKAAAGFVLEPEILFVGDWG
ncbi:MAG: UDP-N-acetylmuramate dehydrogenase [Treponema sp.]|jgi:UDP-N-acetylmuramate dehydrogenase|nr:UDP-N-acetylmuramate dehydrogenase [Treponema sp.]